MILAEHHEVRAHPDHPDTPLGVLVLVEFVSIVSGYRVRAAAHPFVGESQGRIEWAGSEDEARAKVPALLAWARKVVAAGAQPSLRGVA